MVSWLTLVRQLTAAQLPGPDMDWQLPCLKLHASEGPSDTCYTFLFYFPLYALLQNKYKLWGKLFSHDWNTWNIFLVMWIIWSLPRYEFRTRVLILLNQFLSSPLPLYTCNFYKISWETNTQTNPQPAVVSSWNSQFANKVLRAAEERAAEETHQLKATWSQNQVSIGYKIKKGSGGKIICYIAFSYEKMVYKTPTIFKLEALENLQTRKFISILLATV